MNNLRFFSFLLLRSYTLISVYEIAQRKKSYNLNQQNKNVREKFHSLSSHKLDCINFFE